MEALDYIKRPTKKEQRVAIESYSALSSILSQLKQDDTEIEIEETNDRIKIPFKVNE